MGLFSRFSSARTMTPLRDGWRLRLNQDAELQQQHLEPNNHWSFIQSALFIHPRLLLLRAVIISLTIILMRFSFSLKQTTGLSSLKLMRILKLSASNCDDFHHIWFRSRWKTEGKFYCNHNPFFLSFLFFFHGIVCVALVLQRAYRMDHISALCGSEQRE